MIATRRAYAPLAAVGAQAVLASRALLGSWDITVHGVVGTPRSPSLRDWRSWQVLASPATTRSSSPWC